MFRQQGLTLKVLYLTQGSTVTNLQTFTPVPPSSTFETTVHNTLLSRQLQTATPPSSSTSATHEHHHYTTQSLHHSNPPPMQQAQHTPRWENVPGKLFTALDSLREGCNVLSEKLLDLDSTKDLHPPLHDNPFSGSTTYPLLEDSIDQKNRAHLADIFVDTIPTMFTDEHTLDYSSHLIFDVYADDFLEVESDARNVYDDPFDSKGEKIKESKHLIDELDLPCEFLPPFEYDSFISQDFSRVDALPSTNNEDKIFNPGILIQEKPVEIITRVVQDKKLAISNASLVLEDFDPPFYEPLFFKKVPNSKMLLPFSSENEKKVFKPGIHTSEKVHSYFILKLSHQGYKVFKTN
uniref:Reverse transcriptase domain-containing protein n=1 Tax=Tanacetum cinerariifolium TaxID=118510 RepID=A0A6L2MCT4_TANCI|nr:hypothetical protein [Tanacetum cinerariifolium]